MHDFSLEERHQSEQGTQSDDQDTEGWSRTSVAQISITATGSTVTECFVFLRFLATFFYPFTPVFVATSTFNPLLPVVVVGIDFHAQVQTGLTGYLVPILASTVIAGITFQGQSCNRYHEKTVLIYNAVTNECYKDGMEGRSKTNRQRRNIVSTDN